MFPLKEFDVWEAMANKTYPALKTFSSKAYGRHLTALELCSMSGQNGYASQTIYNVLEDNYNTDDDTVTTITQTAAVTAASTMTTAAGTSGITSNAYSSTINADIAAVFNQLLANQTTIMTQMVALSFVQEPAQHTRWFVARDAFQVPPIQQLAIPTQQAPFQVGTFHAGRGVHQGGRDQGCKHGGWGHTLFANYMHNAGAITAMPSHIVPFGRGNTQLPLGQGGMQ